MNTGETEIIVTMIVATIDKQLAREKLVTALRQKKQQQQQSSDFLHKKL